MSKKSQFTIFFVSLYLLLIYFKIFTNLDQLTVRTDENIWKYDKKINRIIITNIVKGGASDRAGLKNNDILLKINNIDVRTISDAVNVYNLYKNENIFKYIIQRDGKKYEFSVKLTKTKAVMPFLLILVSIFYFLCGTTLFILRPELKTTKILYAFAIISSLILVFINNSVYDLLKLPFGKFFYWLSLFYVLPILIYFFKYFPDEKKEGFLTNNFFVTFVLFVLPYLSAFSLSIFSIFEEDYDFRALEQYNNLNLLFKVLYWTGYFITHSLIYYYWIIYFIILIFAMHQKIDFKNRIEYRHYRLIVSSIYIGFLPLLFFLFVCPLLNIDINHYVQYISILFLIIIPIAFIISVLKYEIWGIKVIIEKSIIYFIYTGLVIVAYGISVFTLSKFFLRISPFADQITAIIVLLIFVRFLHPLKEKLQNFVDRKFFREKFDFRQTFMKFLEKVSHQVKKEQIIDLLLTELHKLLHIEKEFIVEYDFRKSVMDGKLLGHYNLSYSELERINEIYIPKVYKMLRSVLGRFANDHEGLRKYLSEKKNFLFDIGDFRKHYILSINTNEGLILNVISFGKKLSGADYLSDDEDLIKMFLNEVGHSLNSSYTAEKLREQELLKAELELARNVQKKLLPENFPNSDRIEFTARNYPAEMVGGDLYNIIKLDDKEEYWVVIGDVTGKGLPAAILMSNAQSMIQVLVNEGKNSPAEIVKILNKIIFKNTDPIHYITLFIAKIDINSMNMIYCNAGHNYPVLFTNDLEIFLQEGGIPVGMLENFPFSEASIKLNENDLLFLYTDGVVDLENKDRIKLGEENVIKFIRSKMKNSLPKLSYEIVTYLNDYMGEMPPTDDVTFLFAKIK